MPELPEVQTIVNDLQKITGDTITGFSTDWPKAIKNVSFQKFQKEIFDQKITDIERFGKNILIRLSSGNALLIHLRMTGQLLVSDIKEKDHREKYSKHIHHIFFLKKNKALAFSDIRKFGTIELLNEKELAIKDGTSIDPFDKNFTPSVLANILNKKPKKKIKELLLDQSLISGIGNIYASEILFAAEILPTRLAKSLQDNEIKKLHSLIRKVLTKAIKFRGTSFSDYRDSSGKKGSFQKFLKVYGKAGEKCEGCDTIIHKMIIGQRSTFYCPRCQK
ncbi:MAG TPA: bifunctional DNA-formamidopyrimidine glycosylase/DNA-(apurinic or apyrimidinic site) lyase [Patescibacteria group bacterium]